MAKLSDNELRQCGVCGVLTSHGRDIESTNRNPETGTTEFANFICRHCYWENGSRRLGVECRDGSTLESSWT